MGVGGGKGVLGTGAIKSVVLAVDLLIYLLFSLPTICSPAYALTSSLTSLLPCLFAYVLIFTKGFRFPLGVGAHFWNVPLQLGHFGTPRRAPTRVVRGSCDAQKLQSVDSLIVRRSYRCSIVAKCTSVASDIDFKLLQPVYILTLDNKTGIKPRSPHCRP